ncbi:MAG: polysaccharide biosynthesis tyrosine autokinase, partial [Armatimonadaceae bacterium]
INNLYGSNTDISQDRFNKDMDNHKKHMEAVGFLTEVAADPSVSGSPLFAGVDVTERANVIRNMFTFKRETDEIVTLTLNGDEPEEMKKVLQVMVNQYKRKDVQDEKKERTQKLSNLNNSLAELDKKIEERRKVMRDKANGNGGKDDEISRTLIATSITTVKGELDKSKSEAGTYKNKRDLIATQLSTGNFQNDPADLEELFRSSTQVAEKRSLLGKARLRAEQAKAFVEGDPARVEAEAGVKAAEKAVADAEKNAIAGEADSLKQKQRDRLTAKMGEYDQSYQLAQKNAEDQQAALDKLVAEQKGFKNNNIDLDNDKKDLEPLETSRTELTKQKNTLELEDQNSSPRIEVLEDPQIFRNYNLKTKWAFSSIAAVAGLLAVCLLVSYVEWRNRRVDGVDQVVTELGMRVIGTIPAFPSRAALRSGETGANQNWRFILNESVNSTRTMLLHTARTQQMQVILVTSAMQGEGKTSLSSQLATSMATAGLRTLILDCDLRNPSMQKLFDVPVAPGCAEILLQEIDISDAVQQTSVPNLWIIPAGQCNHRVIAALAQGHPIEALLNRLRGQFDIIIVDSCPILPVADTLLVAQHVDGVVFSILQDVSQLPKVQDASERMIQLNIPLLGAVVNGIKPDIQAYGYNYVKQLPA